MTTLLLLAFALAVPVVILFPLLAGDRSRETDGPAWRFVKAIGSAVGLLIAGTLVLFGGRVLLRSLGTSDLSWSGMAISMFLLSQGVAAAVVFFPRHAEPRRMSMAHVVRGVGYAAVAVILLVASFVETLWALLFAAFSGWMAAIYLYMGRRLAH